jgi:hypothetical protein
MTPAVAVFNNQLYVFWKSYDSSNAIFYSASSDGLTWSNGQRINNVDKTTAALSAATYANKLYLVWKSGTSDIINYSPSSDGKNWPAGKPINSKATTLTAPAVAASNGSLYVLWKASDGSGSIDYSASTDGSTWPNSAPTNKGDSTSAAPGLATTQRYTSSFQCDGDGANTGSCSSPEYSGSNYKILYATGGNGYHFWMYPGEHAEFHLHCTQDKVHSHAINHNGAISCSSSNEGDSRHVKIECQNKSSQSAHSINFKTFHCGPAVNAPGEGTGGDSDDPGEGE